MPRVEDLETPIVTVDLDIMAANIRKMQAYCDAHGLRFRPHIKTHKTPEIGRLQLEAGAQGITCQKLGEAEVFADAGFDDIFIPYNLIGPAKLARLTALARRCRVSVAVDSAPVAQGISEAAAAAGLEVPLLIECDTGAGRTGVQTPAQALVLAQEIDRIPGVRFAGLMTFPTNLETTPPFLAEAVALLGAAGLEAETVSGGGTPQTWRVHEIPQITEHRAGTYVFNDSNTLAAGTATLDECAMRVLMTVVSRPTAERAILDGGSKTLSADRLLWRDATYGTVVEYPEAVIYGYSEEHANVDVSACVRKPVVGERVTVIPNHCCTVANLHNELLGVRGGEVELTWRVRARGLVR
ncbi:MAG TPA: D-TA family PLP-dependent enzyme [bacterium]|nr:D-TA family PLP-dependent enzyme [bacterium]